VIFGVVFAVVALAFAGCGVAAMNAGIGATAIGAAGVMSLFWTAAASGLASAAWLLPHGSRRPQRRVRQLYGKRPDGTRAWWSTLLLLPFLGPMWAYWHVRRPLLSEAPWHELLPDLLIGRRLLDREFQLTVDHVVDLTCEYTERPRQRRHPGYLSLPIVDGAAPPAAVLEDYVLQLRDLQGRIYLHCAEGHGRTALVAAAVLIDRGLAADSEQALQRVLAARPKAHPYPEQRRALEQFAPTRRRRP